MNTSGLTSSQARSRQLRAGPVQLRFDPDILWARRWKIGEVEILRAVCPAVRDGFWNTAQPRVRWVRQEIGVRDFSLQLDATYGGAQPFFKCRLALEGSVAGEVQISMTGEALRSFSTNRTGLCVLHPAEAAGRPCWVQQIDGRVVAGRFPTQISASRPFTAIRAIAHSPASGITVHTQLEGDIFEMEDQRNWLDASFKTYSRSLDLPTPYLLKRGDRVDQRTIVRLKLKSAARPSASQPVRLVAKRRSFRPVALGLNLTHAAPLAPATAARLRQLAFRRFRIELDTGPKSCLAKWANATAELPRLGAGAGLEVALSVPPHGGHLEALARVIARSSIPNELRWLVLDRRTGVTSAPAFRRVKAVWSRHAIPGELGGGVNRDFVDLNRSAPIVRGVRFVSYGFDPQVHAFDDTSILETPTVQAITVRQARRLSGGLPVTVAPITLGAPRLPEKSFEGDVRQFAPFAAVWTLASIGALTEGRATDAIFHGTTGPKGILRGRRAGPSPLYRPFAALGSGFFARVSVLKASDPLAANGLILRRRGLSRVLLANHLSVSQSLVLAGLPRTPHTATRLGLAAASRARLTANPGRHELRVTLTPYAILQIDFVHP